MDNRRVAGQTGFLTLTVVLLLVLWGCPPQPAPENETAPPTKAEPVQDENKLLLDEFEQLERIAGTGRVIIRISSDEDEPTACNRVIEVQTFGPTIYWESAFSPRKVTWKVAQRPNGTWMTGDRILLEQKRYSPDCFSPSTVLINYPSPTAQSGEIREECRKEFPVAWYYEGTLFNEECVSNENPEGKVAGWDPVVIIKPRK